MPRRFVLSVTPVKRAEVNNRIFKADVKSLYALDLHLDPVVVSSRRVGGIDKSPKLSASVFCTLNECGLT